jgi:RHS repeat-associated protein
MLSLVGFNGERSDLLTGNYFLGNGYRIFSPSLMRFNKPDNLSPFGAGGINSYFYCKGDPINFSDPTGHFLHSLRKLLVSSSGNLLKKPQLTVSLDLTGGTIGGLSKYQNIKRISGGIYAADEAIIGGGKTLVINGHGREGGHLLSKNQIVEPRNVVSLLKKKGISVRDYNDVHLMICHSAEGGNCSLANYLNRKFGIPVTAYQGQVGTYYSPAQVVKNEAKKISWIYRSSLHVREATFVKSQQMDIRTSGSYISNNGQTQTLNYRPVRIS